VRATLELDGYYKFVFYTENCSEMVRCFYPNGERETVTLDYFCKVINRERAKRRRDRVVLRAYRERNQ
jgi:hypothetical protein